jgi:hypothetical protein
MRILFQPLKLYIAFTTLMLILIVVSSNETLYNYFLVFIIWNLTIIIHECGHITLGLLNGFKFKEFTAIFFSVSRMEDKIIVRENKDWKKVGGVALMLPEAIKVEELARKWKWYAIGGPLGNLLIGIISLLIDQFSPSFFMNIFGLMNLAIGLITVLPVPNSDSFNFLKLYRGDKETMNYLLSSMLTQELLSSKSPLNWSKEVVHSCIEYITNNNVESFEIRVPLFYYFCAINNHTKAKEILDPIKNLSDFRINRSMINSMAFGLYMTHLILNERKATYITFSLLEKTEPYSYYRTKAALEIQGKNLENSKRLLDLAKKEYKRSIKPFGYALVEKSFLDRIEHRISVYDKNEDPLVIS